MRQIAFYISLFVIGSLAKGQEVKFYATVNKNVVSVNQPFTINFTIENADSRNLSQPDYKGFDVLPGGGTSQSMQIINGKVSQQLTISTRLMPKSIGKFTIGKATLTHNGKQYFSDPIEVEVIQGIAPQQQPANPQTNQNLPKENLFIQASINKKEVYEGEQVLLTYKLFTRLSVGDYSLPVSDIPGCWKEVINLDRPRQQSEVINGIRYNTAVVSQVILFPQITGELKIPAAKMTASVQVDFFRSQRVEITSNELNLKVKPLPAQGKPGNFTGAVGNFQMKPEISTTEAVTDEPITFRMTISGEGNFSLIEAPKLELPTDFEVYEPEVKEKTGNSSGQVKGSKTFEFLIVPRRAGDYKLNELSFNYFDPSSGKYHTLTSPVYTIHVEKGIGSGGGTVSGLSKEEVELLGSDIRFIKTSQPSFAKSTSAFYKSFLFRALQFMPFVLFIIVLFLKRTHQHLNKDQVLVAGRKAGRVARARLSQASRLMKENKSKAFYEEIARALWKYLSDKLQVPFAELSRERAIPLLQQNGANEALISSLFELFDRCQMALFAPAQSDTDLKDTLSLCEKLIGELENKLRK